LAQQGDEEEEGQQGINEEVAEDQRRQEALEVYNQQQRQQQQNSNPVADQAKKQAKKWLIRTTWPYWGSALVIIGGIALLIGFVVIIPPALCSVSGASGLAIKAFLPTGFCDAFNATSSQPTITNTSSRFVDLPRQFWSTTNFSVTIGDFPRVKSEVLTRFQGVFAAAQAQGPDERRCTARHIHPGNSASHFHEFRGRMSQSPHWPPGRLF